MCCIDLRRLLATACAGVLVLASSGCVENGIQQALEPFDYTSDPMPPDVKREKGSIWPGNSPSGSFLFFDSKARGVGDLVTVRVVERIAARNQANTDLDKKSSFGASITSDIGFAGFVTGPIRWLFRVLGVSDTGTDVAAGTPTNVATSQVDDTFEGEGTTSRSGSFDAIVTCRVINVLPGRVFHVKGRRAISINHETQYLAVEGLVRQQDVGIDNVVGSDALADAQITLDGLGVIDDKQRPGWMTRALSWLYPF